MNFILIIIMNFMISTEITEKITKGIPHIKPAILMFRGQERNFTAIIFMKILRNYL